MTAKVLQGAANPATFLDMDVLTATKSGNTLILTDESGRRVAVKKADVKASNGVIYIVDSVLLPK